MSDRPTPETDAELDGINAVCKEDRKLDAMTSHARKLEHERDEARAERDILRLDAQREAEHHDRMVGELEKVYAERDEAREDADHWKSEYEIVVARLCGVKHERDNGIIFEHEIIPKLERERDEARFLLKAAQSALDAIHLEVGGCIKIMKENTD